MTETSLLPGMTGADQNAVPAPAELDEPNGDRRRLMAIGGVAGVVVVGAAAFFLLHHGSSSSTTPVAFPHHVVPSTSTSASGSSGANSAGAHLPKPAKHVSEGRNPFKPLVAAPATSGTNLGNTTSVSNDQSTSPAGSLNGTNPLAGPTVTNTTPPSQGGTVTGTGTPQWIQLMKTKGDQSALFKVGYAHNKFHLFSVAAPKASSQRGTVFDGEFSLIGIQGNQVTLQVGDATPFDLAQGVTRQL